MELKLSTEKSIDDRKIEIYEIGKYTVRKLIFLFWGLRFLRLVTAVMRHLHLL